MKNVTEFCQKMLSNRKNLSRVIFLLGKNSCLPTEIEGEGFWCSVKSFGRFVKTELYMSDWGLWLNCFLYELFFVSSLFSDFGQNILQKWRKNLRKDVEGEFNLNNNTFWGKFVFWKNFLLFQFFRVLMKKSADFCRKVFRRIWKTAFYTRSGDLFA